MQVLHYNTHPAHPVNIEEVAPTGDFRDIVAVKGAGYYDPATGTHHYFWYLSDPWRGIEELDVAYNMSKTTAEIWVDGEKYTTVRAHSMEEAVASLGFLVVLDD